MRISFLCSDVNHPVNSYIYQWIKDNNEHEVDLLRNKDQLKGGDILFLISCSEIIGISDRSKYSATLVLHASDLPEGRGWSPHIWQILDGAEEITLCLLEAEDSVDTGRIWKMVKFPIPKHELWNEINASLFSAEMELVDFAVREF